MADFENFGGTGTADDPLADFLAREQGQLAELDDNFDSLGGNADTGNFNFGTVSMGEGNIHANGNSESGGFDPFGGQPQQGTSNEFNNVHSEAGSTQDDTYSAVKSMDTLRQEPEKIKKWRAEQAERIAKKDAEAEKKKAEWRETARRELDDWYRHRDELLEKSKGTNRDSERAFISERDEKKPGGEWERVCRLCDFNPKTSRAGSKDVARMRSILLQLKQNPPVAVGATTRQ